MRALILSDVHANMQALAAVLAAAPEYDIVWNLGDVVGYGASPNETIVCLRELNSIYVRGNHDRACCGLMNLDDFNPVARHAAEWTHAQLSRTRRKWLCDLPQGPVTVGEGLVCVHGSAANEDIYVQTLGEAIDALQAVPGAWVEFYGHTHVQGGFVRSDEAFKLRDAVTSQRGARIIVLDLTEMVTIGGGGIGVLVFLQRWCRDHDIRFKLFNPSRSVRQRLENTNAMSEFDIASLDEMMALLGQADRRYALAS